MKDFLSRNGIWILLAAVIITVTMAALSAFGSGGATPLHNAVGVLSSPFRTGFSTVAGWVDDRIRFADDYDALKEENAELKKRVAKLEEENRQAQSDSAENERLRALLNLRPQERSLQFASAMVVDQTSSNWTRTLTLNQGSDAGISPKDCVIDAQGYLVGVVSDVGTNWSTVLAVIDTDFEIGASVFRTGEAAIAAGDFNLMGRSLLRLNYITSESTLINGDLILTSGLGGYYPEGLVIGTVEDVVTDDSGAMNYALLSPAADYSELSEVFVITDFAIVS